MCINESEAKTVTFPLKQNKRYIKKKLNQKGKIALERAMFRTKLTLLTRRLKSLLGQWFCQKKHFFKILKSRPMQRFSSNLFFLKNWNLLKLFILFLKNYNCRQRFPSILFLIVAYWFIKKKVQINFTGFCPPLWWISLYFAT